MEADFIAWSYGTLLIIRCHNSTQSAPSGQGTIAFTETKNFCKGTQVSKNIAGAKVDTRAIQ